MNELFWYSRQLKEAVSTTAMENGWIPEVSTCSSLENTGIAFSIQLPLLLLKVITIILIIGIFYYYRSEIKTTASKYT